MKLFGDGYDRVFMIKDENTAANGTIEIVQSDTNPLEYQFALKNTTLAVNSITAIEWSLDDGTIMCRDNSERCSYVFAGYGKKTIQAKVTLANGSTSTFESLLSVEAPILLSRHLTITDSTGKKINTDESFDSVLKSYVLEGVIPPETLTFDARDVVSGNAGYTLSDVRWTLSDGKNTLEKTGERVSFDIANTFRYTITGVYTFKKS